MSAPTAKSLGLREQILAVLRETSITDPGEIASKISEQIPDDLLRDALAVTLRAYVREVIRSERGTAPEPPTEPAGGGQGTAETHSRFASSGTNSAPSRPAARSWKGEAIRAWKQRLNERYHVGRGEWKLLSDMSAVDLLAAATERWDHADRERAVGDRLSRWADLVQEHGVSAFGDLPEDVLEGELAA